MVINILVSLIVLLLFLTVIAADYADGICKLFVEKRGYTCEEHKVTTEDGYILSVQRIPTGRLSGSVGAKPPALLQHGLFSVAPCNPFHNISALLPAPLDKKVDYDKGSLRFFGPLDARTWLLNPPDESLGFVLADNGFDVWVANARGTSYSRGHTSLTPNDPEYWNWSWDELAAYDLVATLNYVYSQTGQKSHYVGHSLGTLMAIAAFSRNEAVNMVRSAAFLCPVAFLGQLPSPLVRLAAEAFLAEDIYWLGVREFAFGEEPVVKLVHAICTRIDCSKLEDVITGPNCCINPSSAVLGELQATSTKNLIHLSQMVRQGTIAMYDYGNVFDNNERYGQPTPPEYDITSIPNNIPMLLAYGGNDLLSDLKDVRALINTLSDRDPNKLNLLYRGEYSHLDFIYGVNAKQVVYNSVMAFFRTN